jgi:hypothetical protein
VGVLVKRPTRRRRRGDLLEQEDSMSVDPEAESQAMAERSLELAGLLDAGHPVVKGTPAVLAESARLGRAAHRARLEVAAKVAAGADPGCPVGNEPPVRRVRTDNRGRDLDPLGGRAAVTPELIAFWEYRRDVVFPAVEAMYRRAAEETPYRPALVAAAKGHLGVLRERWSMLSEGGVELEAAVESYDSAFVVLRQNANDCQMIATEAENRLVALRKEAAALLVGADQTKGFITNAISSAAPDTFPIFDDTGRPYATVDAKTGQPTGKAG